MKHDLESIVVNNFIDTNIRIKRSKPIKKIRENEFIIPKYAEYESFNNINYPVSFLKIICKFYKLPVSGNKPILKKRIHSHLLESNYVINIQKNIRRYFVKLYIQLIGPAYNNRTLCMNSTDFFTLETIDKIPINKFFSFKMNNNIWGFDILSIYNLFVKGKNDVLNPYTREKMNLNLFLNIKKLIRINNILQTPVDIKLNNNVENITAKKKLEIKCLELFQYMDSLGNYTNCNWLLDLNREKLIQFIRELIDIWEYRAQLDFEVKKQICAPYGNPFRYTNINILNNLSFLNLQKTILSIIEQFIKKGTTPEFCNLGASYVLCGLTLVNNQAAMALPWLYNSVAIE